MESSTGSARAQTRQLQLSGTALEIAGMLLRYAAISFASVCCMPAMPYFCMLGQSALPSLSTPVRMAVAICAALHAPRPVALIPIGVAAEAEAWPLAQILRRSGLVVDLTFRGKPGQRMRRADRLKARYALFLGDDELAQGVVKLRDLDSGAEDSVARDHLLPRLRVS